MAFCSLVAAFMIKALGMGGQISADAPSAGMSLEFYLMTFGPVAVLFSVSLWLGNLAYLYLEVSYIQMLKAGNVVLVFFVGCLLGTEKPLLTTLANCLWIGLGLFVASYSEANFALVGFLIQLFGVIAEAFRLQLVQMLLSSKVRLRARPGGGRRRGSSGAAPGAPCSRPAAPPPAASGARGGAESPGRPAAGAAPRGRWAPEVGRRCLCDLQAGSFGAARAAE